MAYDYILVEKDSGVAILTMNRPDKLNAMNRQLSAELHDAVKQMETDEDIGCIIITGAGDRRASWESRLFALMHRNAANAAAYFGLPPEDVMEVGMQVEL